ncbi:MAG: hypothetical protein LBI38_02530 [Oscillospiraceae bacterium]|jgi:hypothetical protein|nr:hypothetical protein [Oscillospiraceae bacterium]
MSLRKLLAGVVAGGLCVGAMTAVAGAADVTTVIFGEDDAQYTGYFVDATGLVEGNDYVLSFTMTSTGAAGLRVRLANAVAWQDDSAVDNREVGSSAEGGEGSPATSIPALFGAGGTLTEGTYNFSIEFTWDKLGYADADYIAFWGLWGNHAFTLSNISLTEASAGPAEPPAEPGDSGDGGAGSGTGGTSDGGANAGAGTGGGTGGGATGEDKGGANTGVEGVVLLFGVAVVASGAVVLSRKRK